MQEIMGLELLLEPCLASLSFTSFPSKSKPTKFLLGCCGSTVSYLPCFSQPAVSEFSHDNA